MEIIDELVQLHGRYEVIKKEISGRVCELRTLQSTIDNALIELELLRKREKELVELSGEDETIIYDKVLKELNK